MCTDGRCCSRDGWCGSSDEYCGYGCQSQCYPSLGHKVSDIITSDLFYEMLPRLGSSECPGNNFYTYDSFVQSASNFSEFGTTGDLDTRKREIAAFLAHTSSVTAIEHFHHLQDPYSWGYSYVSDPWAETGDFDYCDKSDDRYPCAPGKKYMAEDSFSLNGADLLNNPDFLSKNPEVSFESAFWFWMIPSKTMPSSHDIMTGQWVPTHSDYESGWYPGFGLTTNVVTGGLACGHGWNPDERDRIGFYTRFCDLMGVDAGHNLSCDFQRPFSTNITNNQLQTM
ncbi:hypothetical protein FNV43_RR22090 [Rhamnella rubrinervis]|uniref:Chitin-binding type-1 domain-containing protein n=1 Tax=Rhamnella rubrinervis TaxID=2594499 RepID=A0A8K0DVH7_9ROSA|nr:hypothetical protein FNV43_RR22090 [Rhamnella rubrinervis]